MPPLPNSSRGKAREARRSRSRNTTPLSTSTTASVPPEHEYTEYLQTPLSSLIIPTVNPYDDLLDKFGSGPGIPGPVQLSNFADELKRLSELARIRSEACDHGMRELAKRRKERIKQEREQEEAAREAEVKKEEQRRAQKKKEQDEERPPAIGVRGLARQDGVDDKVSAAPAEAAPSQDAPVTEHQPSPAPTVPQYQIFGADPLAFDDPTIYHIREITPGMSEEEKKEILGVAKYPASDLHEMTAGTPPDRDFSSAKPANQVTFSAFSNAVEPYIRPLTEEDYAFLQERGDRIGPFMNPRRGSRFYKDIWAEEDGSVSLDSEHSSRANQPSNQPRGSIDDINDEVAATNEVSAGPLLTRLLATLRSDHRSLTGELNGISNGVDEPAVNGITNGDVMDADGELNGDHNANAMPSATSLPESSQPGWKAPVPKLDYAQLDERVKAELRYIGILSEDDPAPDYDGHFDDEVAARLRLLQEQLREVMIVNGARKARVSELTQEKMAQQEWNTITDDLDNQLNQAFSKRNRSLGKSKKNTKRPGGAGLLGNSAAGAGIGKPSVGEPIRSLMERREQWYNTIGPVVDYGRTQIPKGTIFDDESMEKFKALERERMEEEVQE